jgi:hypothetical protein
MSTYTVYRVGEKAMRLDDLLRNVERQWHSEFLRFIETGDASDAFLEYLDRDQRGQQAVEMAFNSQAAAFEGLAEELKTVCHKNEEATR